MLAAFMKAPPAAGSRAAPLLRNQQDFPHGLPPYPHGNRAAQPDQYIPAEETGAFLRYLLTSPDMESSCNKLFRTELLEKNGIRFNASAVVFEDFQFVLDYLSACAPGISLVKRTFYHYRVREEGNGQAQQLNLVQDIDMLAAVLAWTDTLASLKTFPWSKAPSCKISSVIFHPPAAALRPQGGVRDFLSSGLAAHGADLRLVALLHLVCRPQACGTAWPISAESKASLTPHAPLNRFPPPIFQPCKQPLTAPFPAQPRTAGAGFHKWTTSRDSHPP